MRIYAGSDEEALRTRKLLADWAGEGILTKTQSQRLEQETVSELRTTNIFLRLILFLFTLITVGAAAGLLFRIFLWRAPDQATGIFFLILAAVCYAAAEAAVSQAHLYRYGIEEALAVCAVGFLCAGMEAALFSGRHYPPSAAEFLVPAAGGIFSLWIWRRFGFWYGFPAAMIFAIFLPGYWTSSPAVQRVIIVLLYALGLICVTAVGSRDRSGDFEDDDSLAESLLWLGIYFAINLQLSSLDLRLRWWGIGASASEFARPFYWTTWVLIWCLPPVVLVRGVRHKDRFVIAVGAIIAVLTLLCNKPYLGWPRHTWDPMLLGIFLAGVAWCIQRWLGQGTNGVRHGFTAARRSGKDKQWMNASSAVLGLVTPQSLTPSPQTSKDFRFDGGASGGGGASGEF